MVVLLEFVDLRRLLGQHVAHRVNMGRVSAVCGACERDVPDIDVPWQRADVKVAMARTHRRARCQLPGIHGM